MARYQLKKLKKANELMIGSIVNTSAAWEVSQIPGLRMGCIRWHASRQESALNGWRVFVLARDTNIERSPLAVQVAEHLSGQVFATRAQALEAIEAAALISDC